MSSDARHVCSRYHLAVECIGARWSGAIIQAIFSGVHRYGDLRAAVHGLSDTMLSQRLHVLEAEGIVERCVLATTPVRVEYHLTAKGLELEPVLQALVDWSHKWVPLPDEP